jgi:hypothetical protein
MNYQIKIQFSGEYRIDVDTVVKNPLVTAVAATDDFLSNVAVGCLFENTQYSYFKSTGSFEYETSWDNTSVEQHINKWMNERKV